MTDSIGYCPNTLKTSVLDACRAYYAKVGQADPYEEAKAQTRAAQFALKQEAKDVAKIRGTLSRKQMRAEKKAMKQEKYGRKPERKVEEEEVADK